MDKRRLIERVLVLCNGKPHTASMLREALGVSAGPLLAELARAGRLRRRLSCALRPELAHLFSHRLYFYETTIIGARHAIALIRERKEEEAEGVTA